MHDIINYSNFLYNYFYYVEFGVQLSKVRAENITHKTTYTKCSVQNLKKKKLFVFVH